MQRRDGSSKSQNGFDADLIKDHSISSLLNTTVKKMRNDSIIYFPSSIIPAITAIVFSAYMTRTFPPEDYGIYALIMTSTSILNTLLSNWSFQSIVRYRATYRRDGLLEDFNLTIVCLLFSLTLAIFLLALIIYFASGSLSSEFLKFFFPTTGFIITSLWFINLVYILNADLRSSAFSFFISARSVLGLVFSIVWAENFSHNVPGLLWGMLIADLVLLVPLILICHLFDKAGFALIRKHDFTIQVFFSHINKFARYGFPLIGVTIGVLLLNTSDRYFIEFFRGSAEVGIYIPNYNISAAIFSVISVPLNFASNSVIMKTVSMCQDSDELAQKAITSFSRYFLMLSFPLFTFLLVFSKDIVSVLFGEAYEEGFVVIPIILFGYLVWNLATFGNLGFKIKERTSIMFLYIGLCLVVNVSLNFIFVPWLGYLGAAITSLIGLCLYPILVYFGSRRTLAWRLPWSSLFYILLSSGIMAGILMITKYVFPVDSLIPLLICSAFLGFLAYISSLLVFKELSFTGLLLLKNHYVSGK